MVFLEKKIAENSWNRPENVSQKDVIELKITIITSLINFSMHLIGVRMGTLQNQKWLYSLEKLMPIKRIAQLRVERLIPTGPPSWCKTSKPQDTTLSND